MNIMDNIRLVTVIAIVSGVSVLAYVDQAYAITSLIDEAKEKGLPYLTSVQVQNDVLKLDDKSLLVLQVDFHSQNNTDIWVDIKPVIEKQFILYHKAGFSTATGIDEPYGGEVKNQHRIQDYVEYDDSVIRLNSNESKQIPVHVEVPAEYLGKFQNQPLPILVGFELIDSNVLEKLPRDLEKLEIKFESSSDKKTQNPVWDVVSKATDDMQDSDKSFSLYEKQVRYNVSYDISNGMINDMTLFCENGSLLIDVSSQSESDVNLDIKLPRNMLDPKTDGEDDVFFVLRDGDEIDYEEIPYSDYRKLSMSFPPDTDQIEIIHGFVLALKPPMCKVADNPPYSSILPPLKQIQSGVPIDEIQCKKGLVQVFKDSDKSTACITLNAKSKLMERGWAEPLGNIDKQRTVPPEPPLVSESTLQLHDAKKLLESAYYENVNLGPLKINDVILGFGIENNALIMDVKYRYSTSSEMDIVKKKIRDIVGEEIPLEYIPFKPPPRMIEMAMPYHWNEYLHKNNIEFVPADTGYGNNDDGIGDGNTVCSPLMDENGTEFYIASTVNQEPFEITDTYVVEEKPQFCKKTWKTDVILEEPNRIISLWLKLGQGKIPSE